VTASFVSIPGPQNRRKKAHNSNRRSNPTTWHRVFTRPRDRN